MGRGIGADNSERHLVHNFVMEDVRSVANRADPAKLGNAVTVLVYTDVALNVENPFKCLVWVVCVVKETEDGRVAYLSFSVNVKGVALTAVLLNLVLVISHRDKLRDSD